MTNKKDLYDARHRMPTKGSVRTLTGERWEAKPGGGFWFNPTHPEALSTAKLHEQHGPLIMER